MNTAVRAYQASVESARRGAQDELIVSHLPLVRHVIGRLAIHFPPGLDVENLESAGALGLVEAARHFDPTRNVLFKTYAFQRIRGAVLDELRRNSPLPQQVQERVTLVRRAAEQLPAPVTLEQLAQATGLTPDEVADTLAAQRFSRLLSDDTPLDGRPDVNGASPSDPLEAQETQEHLVAAIEALPVPQRTVVTLYYREDLRLKEIAAIMQLSESRISRLLSAALLSLRERLRAGEN